MPRRYDALHVAVLGLLQESPLHGYELRKRLDLLIGALRRRISFGSLYPALRALEADGLADAGDALRDALSDAEAGRLSPLPTDLQDALVMVRDSARTVLSAFSKLLPPEKRRHAVALYQGKKHSIAEICRLMGISKPTLYSYVDEAVA